jgi:hypothetical protein
MESQLVADEAFWRRVPVAAGNVLWPLEILSFGWTTGWWAGILTVALVGLVSATLPPRLRVSIYLVDLLERLIALPLDLCWLAAIWHLWAQEPLFPILGQPAVGAAAMVIGLWLLTRLLALVTRLAVRQFPSGVQG